MPKTTTNDQMRDRLKAVRESITETRDERAAKLAARDQAKEAFANAELNVHDGGVTDTTEFKNAEQAVKDLGETEDKLADLQRAEGVILSTLGESVPDPDGNGNGPSAAERAELRGWDGERLLKAEGSAYTRALEDGTFTSQQQFGSVVLGEIASREETLQRLAAIDSTNKLGATSADRRGFVQPLLKPLSFLDLIPFGTTDSNSVEYVQVTAVPTGAVETAELAAKAELGLTTVDATAPVRTVAGYVKLGRQALDDVAGLSSLINTLLPYEVRRRLEAQTLSGDGVGQNLKGILATSGIGAPAFVAGDNPADAILRAMTAVILSDGEPNFAAINPITWQNIRLMREDDATRTGLYLYGSPAEGAAPTIWGLMMTPNRTVPQATPLVGDSNGAMVLVREGVNIKVSDSDQDDFTKNRVTVLGEGRFAFPVWRPASFAKAALS